ncbi:MAG TPA: glycine cleavage system protein GcvH [Candidatus Hydrogenedentes bacterium]|nr:glycine cleavage system protein GcvH [Candidatus Hydrogenedentota bacterium]HOL76574.1 glycine cleavage system protein GcvH [Candidatus Hydrogenedentota bacterium]HPO85237.1 glycine cleavage system protein GcvH [Candidatus Hydrogenedentota bacterium]
MFPDDLYYTEDHEWIRDEGSEYVVGITSYAVEQLGDITYVELPELGADVIRGETVATVESVKAASDVYSPVGGHICEVNDFLESRPELVNEDPYGEGWFFKLDSVRVSELNKLMKADAYEAYIKSLEK